MKHIKLHDIDERDFEEPIEEKEPMGYLYNPCDGCDGHYYGDCDTCTDKQFVISITLKVLQSLGVILWTHGIYKRFYTFPDWQFFTLIKQLRTIILLL